MSESRGQKETEWGVEPCVAAAEGSAADPLEEADEVEVADGPDEEDESEEPGCDLRERGRSEDGERTNLDEGDESSDTETGCYECGSETGGREGGAVIDLGDGDNPTPAAAERPVDVEAAEECEDDSECEGDCHSEDVPTGA